ncbi:hypothetical protein JX266_011092 [Neoarthrinium moseri]|nr:hypothetical protein JX266_011092 [Neoarthrinium moseri]
MISAPADTKGFEKKGLDGKVVPFSQGRTLRGSSAINGQVFVANSKPHIDAWAEFGNEGWDWKALAPYYQKFYTLTRPSPEACKHLRLEYIDDAVHATNGPVQASFPEEAEDPLPTAWVDTFAALGYPASGDPFSGEMCGGYINAMSIDPKSRTRSYAVTAYLEPAETRPNLRVITGAIVEQIIFDTSGAIPNAVGVQVEVDGSTTTITVTKEVILAAGAFGTPKVLELSGVGPRRHLESLGINVAVDNPNVDENLQDHPNTSISFEVADGVKTLDPLSRQEPEALEAAMTAYTTEKAGPLATSGTFVGSLIPLPDFVGPDGEDALTQVQSLVEDDAMPGLFSPYHASFVKRALANPCEGVGQVFTYPSCNNVNPEGAGVNILHHGDKSTQKKFCTLVATIIYPHSRGSVHITSADPKAKPAIDPRYLEHPADLEILARFLQYFEKIISTEPLSKLIKRNGSRNGAPLDLSDLEVAKTYTKRSCLSCWHATSSCAMLPRERGGVVNSDLLVYGTTGLRIVDSSVIPSATRGNTQTTVYAVAERAADMIKASHGIATN